MKPSFKEIDTKVNEEARGQTSEQMQTSLDHICIFSISISEINEVFSYEQFLYIFDIN